MTTISVIKIDFDLATSNGEQIPGSTAMWASSGYYAKKKRTSMDDLESLVFSMWYVAGVRVGPEPEGSVLCECKKRDTAEARMQVSRNISFRMNLLSIFIRIIIYCF